MRPMGLLFSNVTVNWSGLIAVKSAPREDNTRLCAGASLPGVEVGPGETGSAYSAFSCSCTAPCACGAPSNGVSKLLLSLSHALLSHGEADRTVAPWPASTCTSEASRLSFSRAVARLDSSGATTLVFGAAFASSSLSSLALDRIPSRLTLGNPQQRRLSSPLFCR